MPTLLKRSARELLNKLEKARDVRVKNLQVVAEYLKYRDQGKEAAIRSTITFLKTL